MRFDIQTMFSDAQEVSSTSTESSVVEVGKAGFLEGQAFIAVRVVEGEAGAGLKTVKLQGSDDNQKFNDIVTVAVPAAEGDAPAGVNIKVPQACPAYLKLVYEGEALTGKVTAGITLCADSAIGKRIGDYEAN